MSQEILNFLFIISGLILSIILPLKFPKHKKVGISIGLTLLHFGLYLYLFENFRLIYPLSFIVVELGLLVFWDPYAFIPNSVRAFSRIAGLLFIFAGIGSIISLAHGFMVELWIIPLVILSLSYLPHMKAYKTKGIILCLVISFSYLAYIAYHIYHNYNQDNTQTQTPSVIKVEKVPNPKVKSKAQVKLKEPEKNQVLLDNFDQILDQEKILSIQVPEEDKNLQNKSIKQETQKTEKEGPLFKAIHQIDDEFQGLKNKIERLENKNTKLSKENNHLSQKLHEQEELNKNLEKQIREMREFIRRVELNLEEINSSNKL